MHQCSGQWMTDSLQYLKPSHFYNHNSWEKWTYIVSYYRKKVFSDEIACSFSVFNTIKMVLPPQVIMGGFKKILLFLTAQCCASHSRKNTTLKLSDATLFWYCHDIYGLTWFAFLQITNVSWIFMQYWKVEKDPLTCLRLVCYTSWVKWWIESVDFFQTFFLDKYFFIAHFNLEQSL